MKQVKTSQTGFVDPNKLKSIDVLDRFCRLHLWSININNDKVVNGFNKGDYYIRKYM